MNNLEVSCNVCGWTGKRLLKHLELKEVCRSKTDMEKVKVQLKEREKQRKREHHRNNKTSLLKKKKYIIKIIRRIFWKKDRPII